LLVRTGFVGNYNHCRPRSNREPRAVQKTAAYLFAWRHSWSDAQLPRPFGRRPQISADRTFGVNYGHRFLATRIAALYGELEFAARTESKYDRRNRHRATELRVAYLTPGLRLKFSPGSRLSPWGVIGGGYALYQESEQLSNRQNTTNKFLSRGVLITEVGWTTGCFVSLNCGERCAISSPAIRT